MVSRWGNPDNKIKRRYGKKYRSSKRSSWEICLKINEKKIKVLHVRGTEKVKEIGGYKVEKEVKYLGVWVGGKVRDIFRAEKRLLI